jgi:hypothetical protein
LIVEKLGVPAGAINDLHKTGRIFANDRGYSHFPYGFLRADISRLFEKRSDCGSLA